MFELLIVLIIAPFVSGICDMVYNLFLERKLTNPFALYKDLFVNLKKPAENDNFNPFSAISLSAGLIAAISLFNISANLDYIIFLSFILIYMLADSYLNSNTLSDKIVLFAVYSTVMTVFYQYMQNPVFESLLEIKDVNTYSALILAIVFLLLSSYFCKKNISNNDGIDCAFLTYSRSIYVTLFIAMAAMMFNSENLFIFTGFIILGAVFTGTMYFVSQKIVYLRDTFTILSTLLFILPALLAYWQ